MSIYAVSLPGQNAPALYLRPGAQFAPGLFDRWPLEVA